MATSTKRKQAIAAYDADKACTLQEAFAVLKKISYTRFDASVDIDIRLGVDPRKGDQIVRGVVHLPHGTGKTVRVLALCEADKQAEAKEAGADYVGLEEYLTKIEKGWTEIDAVITQPSLMPRLGKLGRILGPRSLMPNPKLGTVTDDIGKGIKELKAGKIDLRTDKYAIIHAPAGRVSFSIDQLLENTQEVLRVVNHLKPSAAKGIYIRSVFVSSTMSPSVEIDRSSL